MLHIARLIQFALRLVQLANFSIGKKSSHHNRASPMLYGDLSSFTNSSSHVDSSIWVKDFKHWFVCPKDFFPILYCPVFVHLGSLVPFWHCFASSTVVSWQQFLSYRPALQSLLYAINADSFFNTTLVRLCSDVWSSQSSLTQVGDRWNCLLLLLLHWLNHPYYWACFVSFPDIS